MFKYNANNMIEKKYEQEIDMLLLVLMELTNQEGEITETPYNDTIHDCWKVITMVPYEGKNVYGEFHSYDKANAIRMSIVNLLHAIVHHQKTGDLNICNIKQ